jgi:hypothetical protein
LRRRRKKKRIGDVNNSFVACVCKIELFKYGIHPIERSLLVLIEN